MAGLEALFGGDPRQQGILAAAAQILQASGPSRMPTSFGQILGSGLQAGQEATYAAQQRAALDEQRTVQAQLNRVKTDELLRKYKKQQELEDFWAREAGGTSGQMNPQGMTPASHMGGGEIVRAAQSAGMPADIGSLNQTVNAINNGSLPRTGLQGNTTENWYNRTMGRVERLRAARQYDEAADLEKLALQYRPQAKWQTVKGKDGSTLYAPFFDDGSDGPASAYEVAEKLNFQDTGPQTLGLDPFTGKTVVSLKNGVAPNTAAQIAAQRERTSFERQQAGKPVYDRERGVLVDPKTGIAVPIRNADGTEFGTKEKQQRLTDAKTVVGLLDEAEGLIEKSTSSYGGWAADQVARIGGYATDGAKAGAQLKVISGSLVGAMPKFPGPASNLDVQLYREAAGQLEDTTLPVSTRLAAAKTLRGLNNKALGLPADARQDGQPAGGAQPVMSLNDIAETARRSGRSTAEVTAAARAKGFKIQGDR